MPRSAPCAAIWISLGLLLGSGCGPTVATTAGDRDLSHMRVLGLLYGRYMSDHGGSVPADQAQLAAYLEREPANWEKLAASPAEFLTKGRDGHPLVVLYGKEVKTPADGGLPWVAYESAAIDGQRMIVNACGAVQTVDDQELAQLIPSPK